MKRLKLFSFVASMLLAFSVSMNAADKTVVNSTLTPELTAAVDKLIQNMKADQVQGMNDFMDFANSSGAYKPFKKEMKKKENLTLVAQQLLKGDQPMMAAEIGRLAYETDGGYFPAIMTYGDALYAMKKYGDASALYEAAIVAEPNEKSAYLKTADVYKYINPEHALEVLGQFKEKFPNDPDVNKAIGNIYYYQNKIDEAISAYDTYFAEFKGEDLEAQEQYAIILYIKKDYQGSLDKVNSILPKNPKAIALNRMKFYNLVELMQIGAAKEACDKFFAMGYGDLYNATDYKTMGKLAELTMDTLMQVKAFEKAAELDSANVEVLVGLSGAYEAIGEAEKAVAAYQKAVDLNGTPTAQDYLKEGKIYYSCAAEITDPAKEELKKKYVEEGDKLFVKLSELAKESYLGPFWRARIQTILDPENPIEAVKECYDEAMIRMAGKDESYNTQRKECLVYTAFYYFKKDDYNKSADYCGQVLEIDPTNKLAANILNAIGQLKK